LEDKVAALQAQNDQANSENENLRDLLSRLQNENVALKTSSFTFSVPKRNGQAPTPDVYRSPPRDSSNHSSPNEPIDWNSLTAFDPSVLKLLDQSPQPTATGGAMNMDFGFGESNSPSNIPFTTLASNQFMTFADAFDSPQSPFNFDMQSLTPWSTPAQQHVNPESLEGLFTGHYMDTGGPVDVNVLPPSTYSPVVHAGVASTSTSVSSPASNFSLFNTPKDSSASEEDSGEGCPKTREEAARRIAAEGNSPFAPAPPQPTVRKGSDGGSGPVVTCKGSVFPATEENDQNIEVLSAWRSIRSNPKFKVCSFLSGCPCTVFSRTSSGCRCQ
jgi:AP-1-like factor